MDWAKWSFLSGMMIFCSLPTNAAAQPTITSRFKTPNKPINLSIYKAEFHHPVAKSGADRSSSTSKIP
jgi:hypothetical protein